MKTLNVSKKWMRNAVALALVPVALAGCYVIPVDQYGRPVYPTPTQVPTSTAPSVSQTVVWPGNAAQAPVATGNGGATVFTGAAMPTVLNVRLYPVNDIATQTGMMTGTVTNMMSGKGRFQFDYRGEVLTGEATRVSNDERRGIANAYGQRGSFANCEYQMSSPVLGAGTCTFNNGARYEVHIGG